MIIPIAEFVPMVGGPVDPNPDPDNVMTTVDNWATWPTEDNWATWPTEDNWATWPTTAWPTDEGGEALLESAGKQFSRGYYVAIGLGVLLMIAIVVIVVIVVILYKRRQRKNQKGKALNESMDHGVCVCVHVCCESLIVYVITTVRV